MPFENERLELLISEQRIRARVTMLARQISSHYGPGEQPSVVVVLKGAFIFAADLVRRLDALRPTIDFVSASSYGQSTRSSGKVAIGGLDHLDVKGRPVLVIEDILDTGHTISALLAKLQRCGPTDVMLCTLLRKPGARALELPVAYVGFDIPDDFVVGYGLDYAERYRELRGIYRLSFDAPAA